MSGMRSVKWKAHLGPLLVIAASVPVFALVEAGLTYLSTLADESRTPFWWVFRGMLLPWAELAALMPFVLLLARALPLGGPRALRNGALHALASLAVGTTHLFLDVWIWGLIRHESQPLLQLTAGLISRYMLQDVFLYWTVVGGLQLFRHQRLVGERELREARLSAELAEARLAALQSRLEPHFLFNALNTAVMLVRDDRKESAVEVLVELSDLLRAVLDGARKGKHQVPLEQEWEFVRRYLSLEKARFEVGLTVEMDLAPELRAVPVPFLILQPLVENALRHGVARREGAGPGKVEVIAAPDGARVRLEVWDNGPGPGRGAGQNGGIGLENVRARLEELYGDRGNLSVGPAPGGGTVARVTLPRGG